jgi:hypothetical protein
MTPKQLLRMDPEQVSDLPIVTIEKKNHNERCFGCIDCDFCLQCFKCYNCNHCKWCIGINGGENLEFVVYGVQFTEIQYNIFIKQNGFFQ